MARWLATGCSAHAGSLGLLGLLLRDGTLMALGLLTDDGTLVFGGLLCPNGTLMLYGLLYLTRHAGCARVTRSARHANSIRVC